MSDEQGQLGPASASFSDPRPAPERIVQLASRVLKGDILLPRFQRRFVWKRAQVLDLLDSINRNYPIGSLLLWQSNQELASERSIGDLEISDRLPGYPVNYLLDGQQRLSTICGALYWAGNNPTSIWNIAFDLRTSKFQHLDTLEEQSPYLLRTKHLTKASNFFSRIGSLPDEMQEHARAFFDRFTDYQTATVTLGDMSITDIGPVFERINSTGTKLTVVDLMRAATWSPEFDLVERINSMLEQLEPKKFSDIDHKTALRCVSAAAGFGFSSANIDSLRDLTREELAGAVDTATVAAKRAADFLATEIGAPGDSALPYTNQFAVLTEIFRRVPHPSSKQLKVVRSWFWRTTFAGYFGGWNTGNMISDYRSVALYESSETLSSPAIVPQESIWRVRSFRSNNATSKMLALMLAHQKPVDLLNGQKIDVGKSLAWNNDKEFHHAFPRAYLKRSKRDDFNALANIVMLTSASNIAISDKPPSQYITGLIEEIGSAATYERFEASLVPREAVDAALEDNFDEFLRLRSKLLQKTAMFLVGNPEGLDDILSPELLQDEDQGVDESVSVIDSA